MKQQLGTLARAAAVGVVLTRLAHAARTRPVVSTGELTVRSISVVIPARNEAARIAPLLEAVVGAQGVGEVIVVDDESNDGTAALARRAGAHVIDAGRLPPGWAGKAWALQRGVEVASGDWVVALDADTRPSPELPAAVVDRAAADETDFLTVAGRFDGSSAGARWLHAAMLTTLVYRFGPPGQGELPPVARTLANGQCMAFRRDTFLAAGGFQSVRGAVVEDVALARYLAAAGRRVDFLDASELLTVVQYDSFAETWRGWGRSIGLPGVEPVRRQAFDAVVLALTLPLPALRLVFGGADSIDLIAVAARLGTLVGTRSAFARHDLAYWTSPLADVIAVAAVVKSSLTRRTTWSGRHYRTSRSGAR